MSSPTTFDSMPNEIHHGILSHLSSCRDDIKALRQTSRRFTDLCAAHLFSSLHISALKRDREVFEQVAASAHLACHVNTLVWEEITGDFDLLRPPTLYDGPGDGTNPDGYERDLLDDLAAQSEALFWLTSYHVQAEMSRRNTNCSSDAASEADLPFWNEFVHATRACPNIYTLVSRPMHPDRELQLAAEGCYPLTAGVVFQYLHRQNVPSEYEPTDTVYNIGFLFYLVPLLNLHHSTGDVRVRQLSFSDETIFKRSALRFLTEKDGNAFINISHLELKITERVETKSPDVDELALNMTGLTTCLTRAARLTSFHLSCDELIETSGNSWNPTQRIRGYFSLYMIPTLPALLSASFENVNFATSPTGTFKRDELSDGPQLALLDFTKRHASTLRELQIVDSIIAKRTIYQLAADPCVCLNRFVMAVSDVHTHTFAVDEQWLLKLMNWNHGRYGEMDMRPAFRIESRPTTHYVSPDQRDLTVAAVNWSLRHRILQGEKVLKRGRLGDAYATISSSELEQGELELYEHFREFQAAYNLWIDRDGVLYDPGTDRDISSWECKNVSLPGWPTAPNDWRVQNGRQWNDHIGLWSDVKPSESWRLYKYAWDRPCCEREKGNGVSWCRERVAISAADANETGGVPVCSRNLCFTEDFEQIVRRERGAKWRYGCDGDDRVWYWQVYDLTLPGYSTECWLFAHRNGDSGTGSDPLDFWADWNGNQHGDKAYPTPFSHELFSFATLPKDDPDRPEGWPLPRSDEIGFQFGPPVGYEVSEDPTIDGIP